MNKQIKNVLRTSLTFIPDKAYCQLTFFLRHKRKPVLKNPVLFNDKMLFMKLSNHDKILNTIVDKYEVRDYVKEKIGEQYLIPLIGVFDKVEQVNFESLPEKFALKPTSGSQHNFICTDKSKVNWAESAKDITKMVNMDYYSKTREWHYKDLAKRFVIEEYIADSKGDTYDYKFWCFNGEPRMVQVDTDRFSGHKRTMFDIEFKKLDLKVIHENHDSELQKPENYDLMVKLATELSKGFPFLRVDLYNIDGKVYFGELSVYPDNCHALMNPVKYEKIIGDMVTL